MFIAMEKGSILKRGGKNKAHAQMFAGKEKRKGFTVQGKKKRGRGGKERRTHAWGKKKKKKDTLRGKGGYSSFPKKE